MIRSSVRHVLKVRKRYSAVRTAHRVVPRLECLEDRTAPTAGITVTVCL